MTLYFSDEEPDIVITVDEIKRLRLLDDNVKKKLAEYKLNLSEIEQDLKDNLSLTEEDMDCLKIEAFDIRAEILKLESLYK